MKNLPYTAGDRCPSCGRSHWHIGRVTAECGFCATAIYLDACVAHPPVIARFGNGGGRVRRMAA